MQFKNVTRKTLAWVLILLMTMPFIGDFAGSMNPFSNFSQGVYGAEGDLTEDARFTEVTFLIDGQEINDLNVDPIGQDTELTLKFSYEVDNDRNMVAGEMIEIDVPEGVELIGGNITGPLSLGQEVDGYTSSGTYELQVNERKLVLTFNDIVETDLIDIKGNVEVYSRFDLENLGTDNPVEIRFIFKDIIDKTFQFKFSPTQSFNTIDKRGQANKAVNADEIEWTIEVNKNLENLSDVIVNDMIASGHTFIEDSLIVYTIDVALDGSIDNPLLVAPEDYNLVIDPEDSQAFSVELGDITSAYRIVYNTKLDVIQENYSNVAAVGNTSSEASVTPTRGALLEKNGQTDRPFNPLALNWEVLINQGELGLEDVILRTLYQKVYRLHQLFLFTN